MSFFEDLHDPRGFFGEGEASDFLSGGRADVADLFGRAGEREADEENRRAQSELERAIQLAIDENRRAGEEAQGFLSPFGGVGLQGVDQAGFLTDPQAQFDFLQNNPLFQLALSNANEQTKFGAASRNRLSAGDTLTQLSNNVLLSASPLIGSQKQSISDLLNFGSGIARAQANTALGVGSDVSGLIQDRGNVGASGILGRQQLASAATKDRTELAGTIISAISDPRLKENKKKIGTENGFTLWSWDWNELANKIFGVKGSSTGVMYDEVFNKYPEATTREKGFGKVYYSMIGVSHG